MGLGSYLQLVASLSMTELYLLIAAPCVLMKEYPIMRRNGVHVFFLLSVLMVVGGVISIIFFRPPIYFVVRSMAVAVLVSSAIVVMHRKLRKDPDGFKWYLLGGAISFVLCTFIFQRAVEVAQFGEDANEIMNGSIYWIGRLGAIVGWPARAFYLQLPVWISCCFFMFMAVFSMATTASGRSTALGALGAVVVAILGGRTYRRMRLVGRHFLLVVCIGFGVVWGFSKVYKTLALNGTLGEEARKKYIGQTKIGTGLWGLLMGGRCDSIAPFYICARYSPLLGFGPFAIDTNGYYVEFLTKYGAPEDIAVYERDYANILSKRGFCRIPGHSCMGSAWLQYGIFGLLFWMYICYALIIYFKKYAWAVPQWYGWLACGVPSMFWAIFFSAFAMRVEMPMFVVACLLSRAAAKGAFRLPIEMQVEGRRSR